MTTPTDEITNLRAGLDDILTWCHNTATHTFSDVERAACNHIAAMARRALKTPRAPKVVEPSRWDDGGGAGGFGH